MESFKIIDISGKSSQKPKKKLSKKQIYKEILSSSDKVQEIINNRKKTKRFDYLNTIPKIKETEPIPQPKPQPQPLSEPIPKEPIHKQLPKFVSEPISTPKNERKTDVKRQKTPTKDSKINQYFNQTNNHKQNTVENKMIEKAQQSIIEHLQTTARKSPSPKNTKPVKRTISPPKKPILKSQPKQFTVNQIKEIIRILVKLDSLNQYSKIHKTIRRLNKIKVNQLLYSLRLIKKYSNAPDNMLKTTLFNYITSDIKVQLQ